MSEIPIDILNRKGVTKLCYLTDEIRNLLNAGLIASVNLIEWLSVDHQLLVKAVLPAEYHADCLAAIGGLNQRTAMKCIPVVGETLYNRGVDINSPLFQELRSHASDSVRCWATYIIGLDEKLSIEDKLKKIKSFAADDNFGVREIAWMAVRKDIDAHLETAIEILSEWVMEESPYVRRFATESTRPRGVWCKHIDKLKEEPQLAICLLEPLKSDPHKYVQDSVANWLNDASKTRPDFVRNICEKWLNETDSKETKYIVKKALRSIK